MRKDTIKIPILGIDNNYSNDAVTDGMCETLHNARNTRGEWQAVKDFAKTVEITDDSYKVIYKHSALPDGRYICQQGDVIAVCQLNNGTFTLVQQITEVNDSLTVSVTSYGNVLHITQSGYFDQTYLYKQGDDEYVEADVSSIEPPKIEITDYTYSIPNDYETFTYDDESHKVHKIMKISQYEPIGSDADEELERTDYYNTYDEGTPNKTWCFFVAYKMYDGTVIKMSEIIKIRSADDYIYFTKDTPDVSERKYTYTLYSELKTYEPSISIETNLTDAQKELVDKLVVYATRDLSELLFDKIDLRENSYALQLVGASYTGRFSVSSLLNDEIAIESPFYEVETLDLDTTEFTFDLEDHFDLLETNTAYEASLSHIERKSANKLYYNSRLHEWDVQMKFSEPCIFMPKNDDIWDYADELYGQSYTYSLKNGATMFVGVMLEVENDYYYAWKETEIYTVTKDGVEYIRLPRILTYPDYRATKIRLTLCEGLATYHTIFEGDMTSVVANNIAYCEISDSDAYVALPLYESMTPLIGNSTYYNNNVVYISESANPFSLDTSSTLSVDGEDIIRLAVAIDQLAESKFGENPLFIFTSAGMHIAELGEGEVLYSRTSPLNQDVVTGTSPIIALNGALIYITSAGVKVISQSKDSVISSPLHDTEGNFLAELKGVDFGIFDEHYNEVILYNTAEEALTAYVYSLDNNVWSTREFNNYQIIGLREMADSAGIYDLGEPEDVTNPLSMKIVTRLLKFGSDEKKRIDTLIARVNNVEVGMELWGSNDGCSWKKLREGERARLRRTAQSCRYFYVVFSTEEALTALTSFEVEFRNRFVNHLR